MLLNLVLDNMNPQYEEIVQLLTARLLSTYTDAIDRSQDVNEYFAVVIAALVFKNLAMSEFRSNLIDDVDADIDSNPDDICKEMEKKADYLAQQIKNAVFKATAN